MKRNLEEQEQRSDRVLPSTKTSKALSQATKEKTSRQSSRRSSASQSQKPLMCLCLIRESGPTQDSCSMRWGGVSVAWRLHDAQFWGVPQRRERISVVADFGGLRAGEILFECESVQGHFNEGGASGQDTSAGIGSCPDRAVGLSKVVPPHLIGVDMYNQSLTGTVSACMRCKTDSDHVPCVLIIEKEREENDKAE